MPENRVPEPLRSPKVVAPDLGTWFGEDMLLMLLLVGLVVVLVDAAVVVDDLFTMLIG